MADFSFLSDTDDSAVEDLLSQTQDLCILEQLSAINCSGFTDSVLPTELESRFQKLKSFPLTKSKPGSSFDSKTHFKSGDDSAIFSPSKHNPKGDADLGLSPKSRSQPEKPKSKCGFVSSPSDSSISDEILKPSMPKKVGKSQNSEPEPVSSPPRKTGCFWCSPKKSSEKKNRIFQNDVDWSKNNEFLSDLNIFSSKEQQKIMKMAMKEEEKINREAEKIVKWAKQASARMNISDIEDEFSDHDSKN